MIKQPETSPHVCFDVGCHLGDWTAQLLGEAKHAQLVIYPFEPAPAQYDHIATRLAGPIAAGQVKMQRVALAAESGTTEFFVTGDDSGDNAIATANPDAHGERITVALDTIDQFCAKHGIETLTLVKVDTEGNDFNVIAGASEMLAAGRIGVLQFEYNWRWVAFGHMLRMVFKAIEGLDYHVAQITGTGLEVHDEWHPELERFSETNFALVRTDMLARLSHRRLRFDNANTLVVAV
jgi:FkbM family methyltransferase